MHRHIRSGLTALFCATAMVAGAGSAHAGVISTFATVGTFPPGFSFVSEDLAVTSAANNDNSGVVSPNHLDLALGYGGIGVFDLVYTVMNSQGTTEYFVDQASATTFGTGVTNNSGVNWSGYSVELGFGSGRSFVRSGGSDFLDFDTPERDPSPTSSVFATLDHSDSNRIVWTNGALAPGATGLFTFTIDVPDYSQAIPSGFEILDQSGAIVGYRFTLRQSPVVPEPATLSLLGLALVGVARRRFGKH